MRFVNHSKVELAVGNGGMRSYKGVVAVLRGIAARHYKRFLLEAFEIVDGYAVFFRLVFLKFLKSTFHISNQSAATFAREAMRHRGVETETAGTEKRSAVGGGVVAGPHSIARYHPQCRLYVHGYAHVARQTVAAAQRYYAQHGTRAAQGSSCFIDRAVAAYRQNSVASLGNRLTPQTGSIATACGKAYVHIIAESVKTFFDELSNTAL